MKQILEIQMMVWKYNESGIAIFFIYFFGLLVSTLIELKPNWKQVHK